MKKFMLLCSMFVLVVVLAACGDIDEKNSREVTPNNKASAEVGKDAEVEEK